GVCLMPVALSGGLTSASLTMGLVAASLVIVPSEVLRHFVGVENLKRGALRILSGGRTRAGQHPSLPIDPHDIDAKMSALGALSKLHNTLVVRDKVLSEQLSRTLLEVRAEQALAQLAPLSLQKIINLQESINAVFAPASHTTSEAIETSSQLAAELAHAGAVLAEAFAQIQEAMLAVAHSGPALAEVQAATENLERRLRVEMFRGLAFMEARRSHWNKAYEYAHEALHDLEEVGAR
ncbi:MAG: hypothetical protein ACRDH2_19610, partial [Anaerolineales bacterium]